MNINHSQRAILQGIADRAMLANGLSPNFSDAVTAEVRSMVPATDHAPAIRDLTSVPWSSIDNDDSRDLDQLTVAERVDEHRITVRVAVADVDASVRKGSPTDEHARQNTTSVYTAAKIFPMLPERLSTDLTSLNAHEDRLAIVVEMVVGDDGTVESSDVYRARVRNQAKLAYGSVGAWLEGQAEPAAVTAVDGLADNLRLQDEAAQRLRHLRHVHGALDLETMRARPVFDGDHLRTLDVERKNRAAELIEDFMIAANGVTARFLAAKNVPSIRRVVRTPKRWDRIVALAQEHGATLPASADSAALNVFLAQQHAADPEHFPDLSLAVIKMMGAGEYVAERPGDAAPGHFGLAIKDYSHSTAPNRRYPDLVTQRLVKAAIAGGMPPYRYEDLEALAKHVTQQENAANKVERTVGKSAAALLLQSRIGEQFDALVTGASSKGTWARLLALPVEGRVIGGFEGVDVGDRIRVQLTSVDVERGFIDFTRIN